MDFLYLQQGLESRPCSEILYIMVPAYNVCAVMCLLYVNPLEKAPPPYALYTIVLLLCTSSIFKDTLYFLLKYVLPPVLFYSYSSRFIVNYFHSNTNSK
jgi:hypothetical protein